MKYWVNVTYIFEMAAILANFSMYRIKLRALILCSVMYQYWSYLQERN